MSFASGVKMLACVHHLVVIVVDNVVAAPADKGTGAAVDERTVPDVPSGHFIVKVL
jgi:hypothetical protein